MELALVAPLAAANSAAKPFLRWVGGKRHLATRLVSLVPSSDSYYRYFEPFVGAGSLFFTLKPRSAVLSDLNRHLIECYRYVRGSPLLVHRYLCEHARDNSESHYYRIRGVYNESDFTAAQAARFIYLNHTSFNGVFRVNRQGAYNVPFGAKASPRFPTMQELLTVSRALSGAKIRTSDYELALEQVGRRDFVYLDPPYPPLNGTSYFTHYTPDRFSRKDQDRLASVVRELDRSRALVLMTNADTPLVRSLYKRFILRRLAVTRYVTCKAVRHRVQDLVIANYER